MKTNNNKNKFTITDERLEWDPEDLWSSYESPETPDDVGSETVESPERKRTVLVALEGAIGGGLLVGLVMTLVMLSASGASSASPVAHVEPVTPGAGAWVVSPAATEIAHHTVERTVKSAIGNAHAVAPPPRKQRTKDQAKHRAKRHRKAPHGRHLKSARRQPASTRHIRSSK
jgi:hypothetical protein